MSTFYGDPAKKEELVGRAEAHQAADHYMRMTFGHLTEDGEFRGCAIGCLSTPIGQERKTVSDFDKQTRGVDMRTARLKKLAEDFGLPASVLTTAEDFSRAGAAAVRTSSEAASLSPTSFGRSR